MDEWMANEGRIRGRAWYELVKKIKFVAIEVPMAWFGRLHRQQVPLARFENIVPELYVSIL